MIIQILCPQCIVITGKYTSHCKKITIFGRITGGGGAGRSKHAIKENKVLGYSLINDLVRTKTLEPTPLS